MSWLLQKFEGDALDGSKTVKTSGRGEREKHNHGGRGERRDPYAGTVGGFCTKGEKKYSKYKKQ